MNEITVINFGDANTLLISIIVVWIGISITKKVNFLKIYNIPEPVTGGLICSLIVALLDVFADTKVYFDLHLRDFLLLVFFSTIGLSANLRLLQEGGKALLILLIAAIVFLVIQNVVGLFVSFIRGGHPAYGLLAGSITFAGGHGTGITYAKFFAQQYDLSITKEAATAFATFGLVFGGVIGGPIAKRLINKYQLEGDTTEPAYTPHPINKEEGGFVNINSIINGTFVITLCIVAGEIIHRWLSSIDLIVPLYLPSLFVGILITNGAELIKFKASSHYINVVGFWSDVSLMLFLAMSLMSLELLIYPDYITPMVFVLILQVSVMVLFAYYIIFPVMGRDYDAAVITSGFAGLGLGATPIGMANMRAITARFGASAKAFLIIPLLGAFFIDIVNAIVIQFFLELPLFG